MLSGQCLAQIVEARKGKFEPETEPSPHRRLPPLGMDVFTRAQYEWGCGLPCAHIRRGQATKTFVQ